MGTKVRVVYSQSLRTFFSNFQLDAISLASLPIAWTISITAPVQLWEYILFSHTVNSDNFVLLPGLR